MRVFYIACAASIAAIGAVAGMNLLDNPIEARRTALAQDIRALEGQWTAPQLNSGTPPARHEETIVSRPEMWRNIVEPPKPRPQPFDIEGALRGVQPTRQALGDRVLIRHPGSARGDWFRVGDTVNGVQITEITRDAVSFSYLHVDGKTYTHSIGR